jgi:hypothetical protein
MHMLGPVHDTDWRLALEESATGIAGNVIGAHAVPFHCSE